MQENISRYKNLILIILVSALASGTTLSLGSPPVSGAQAASGENPDSAAGLEHYAAPDGSPGGDGSLSNPWDLQTALSNAGGTIKPGDTLWLRGGTYSGIFSSYLSGNPTSPIVVRSYPGEWAVIDTKAPKDSGDNFKVYGSDTHYWGFELMNSRTSADRSQNGFAFLGSSTGNKFINLVIHDLGNNVLRDGNELYGCILYNNGVDGSGNAHHMYIQNADPNKPVRVVDSVIFNGFAFGVHAYSGGAGYLDGIQLVGNVWFNNGVAQTSGDRKDNVIIAGATNCPDHILLQDNYGWAPGASTHSVSLGRYCSSTNGGITLTNNYLVGNTVFVNPWASVTMTLNTFYQFDASSSIDKDSYPNNTYLNAQPSSNIVIVQPNQYQAGRAHIIVYNWESLDTVEVDVSGILSYGDVYRVRHVENYFAPPVSDGTYYGGALTLPLGGVEPAQPIGPGLIEPSETTGKAFNVFVLERLNNCSHCSDKVFLPLMTK